MRGFRYQLALISLACIATMLFAYFVYKEIFPEYKIYQHDYIALENFRSTYTHEPPPKFQVAVKQIVFEREDKGPALIDRCTSCHVAMELTHFSPTKILRDPLGKIERDKEGVPVKVANDLYVWGMLDKKVKDLQDPQVKAQLVQEGHSSLLSEREKEAKSLESLKTAKVGELVYDVTRVIAMHPLIGKETRPFEFHPIEDYGCTSCHSGNGRGLTTMSAHGPVFEGQYEPESRGVKLEFTEKDDKNDPRFSKVFNDKPSDALLYQTTPILVGNLIQASCVQCHVESKAALHEKSNPEDISKLTENFHRGKELFISQACYACHRIAGFARGGIGPELTLSGHTYPWFLKESIVWPQADLPTSTMPNYHLDSQELEDLMTFLLAQKGASKGISKIEYKVAVQQWEGGKKNDIEKPVPPSKIEDNRYGMTLFATQGCAACHRLEGFQSEVGFRIEQEQNLDFKALYDERQWFRKLFPEMGLASTMVETIEKSKEEIDRHIIAKAKEEGLLDEIDKKYKDTIESLYSEFRYVQRAKNNYYQEIIDKATDPEIAKKALADLNAWKERVHRILFIYIQEYGLGRLIGPRPNWSGVYRSDEWLMEHFHNPAAHVPRSIMPIFPFDDSKFYALTSMLDALGKINRNRIRKEWAYNGFSPENAYQLLCSQCHGVNLTGDGPVAPWIYPIPKNLRNAEFMRNLTREHVINSIIHGVSGTPMPPWGETPKLKNQYDGIPVMTQEEIVTLVDWLFSSLPGETIIKSSKDVPKWNYTPKNVIEELKKESNVLQPEKNEEKSSFLENLNSTKEIYYASLNPSVSYKKSIQDEVNVIFDEIKNPVNKGASLEYFIKKSFYTKENIQRGQEFFELNCAACHGKEADGMGLRASIMNDAKPRMLTNFDWIKTKDDLRLLQSIKYGVAGTAMTPWGDLTSSLQRLQLVIYIRQLSQEKEKREALQTVLYTVFDVAENEVEKARVEVYQNIELLRETSLSLAEKRLQAEINSEDKALAISLYQKELEVKNKLEALENKDQNLVELKKNILKQKNLFQGIGNQLIAQIMTQSISNADELSYIQLIKLYENQFSYRDEKLNILAPSINRDKETASIEEKLKKTLSGTLKDKFVVAMDLNKSLLEEQSKLYALYLKEK